MGKINLSDLRNPPTILRHCLARSAKNPPQTAAQHKQREKKRKQVCARSKLIAKSSCVPE